MQIIRNLFRQWRARRAQRDLELRRALARTAWTPHDDTMRALYAQFVGAGGLAFDVGANVGNRVKIFLALGARVVAFEPQDDCLAALREGYGGDANLTIEPVALGAAEGSAALIISNVNTISSMSAPWIDAVKASGRFSAYHWDRRRTVRVTTLERMITQYGAPDFIKIDVEGFEHEVVRGLTRDRKSTRLNFSHVSESRMPSSA